MGEALTVIICMLSVFGLYALLSRVSEMLLPRGEVLITVDGRGLSLDKIRSLTSRARYIVERDHRLSLRVAVLLYENEQEQLMSLRKEGILVYTVKEVTEHDGKRDEDPFGIGG